MAYIIANEEIIAAVNTELKNGSDVRFSSQSCNGQKDLVNASKGKISRAKKWDNVWSEHGGNFAKEISEGDFLVEVIEHGQNY